MKDRISKITVTLLAVILLIGGIFPPIEANAASAKTYVEGKVYEFDKDNDYKFTEATGYKTSTNASTYGQFSIYANDSELNAAGQKDGVNAYTVKEGNITISYTYSDSLLNASDDEWHLIEDKEKNVDLFKLGSNVQKGALILQRSIDHLNWSDVSIQTNAFENTPKQNASMYETLDVELINGCYYRLVVVYELSRKVDTSKVLWVIPKDEYETKRIAEVYEFYAKMDNEHIEDLQSNTRKYRLGETSLVNDFASYSGSKEIKTGDIHYNWNLGDFFVSGFTSTSEKNGEIVFLKNVGDVVTLWFNLSQDIDALNNNKDLTITADPDGQDQNFGTPKTDFGRGMLIIQYTDYENVKHEPVMYKNYLEANTSLGANTRVQLFEEGDYEVALDYEVTKDQLVDKVGHYRIAFKFSVRNANCMVFPMDVKTGAELTNSSVTPNGFYLDLARSRYLKLYIEKSIWTEGADGLTKDTRFNTTAKDGDKYADEGIYTITVENQYTGAKTTKEIYVGSNRILLAYMTSNYSLAEIQNLVAKGAVIYEDGSIEMPPETYTVSHEFISGTAGMPLPDEVKNMLPTDLAGLENGSEATPGTIEETEVAMPDGTWIFQGWDAEIKVIEGSDQRFVGAWVFEKKVEPASEAETDPEPESEISTEQEPTTEPASTTEPEPTSSIEVPTEPPVESVPAPTNTSEASQESSANTTGGSNNISLVVIGLVVILGAAGFIILRKKNSKKEGQ